MITPRKWQYFCQCMYSTAWILSAHLSVRRLDGEWDQDCPSSCLFCHGGEDGTSIEHFNWWTTSGGLSISRLSFTSSTLLCWLFLKHWRILQPCAFIIKRMSVIWPVFVIKYWLFNGTNSLPVYKKLTLNSLSPRIFASTPSLLLLISQSNCQVHFTRLWGLGYTTNWTRSPGTGVQRSYWVFPCR